MLKMLEKCFEHEFGELHCSGEISKDICALNLLLLFLK